MTDRLSWTGATQRWQYRWRRRALQCAPLALCALVGIPVCAQAADVSPIAIIEDASANLPPASASRPASNGPTGRRAAPRSDEILLISTRGLGTRCEPAAMAGGLRCEQRDAEGRWRQLEWSDLLATLAADRRPTVIYVHG
jgi:hypothetical protein